MSRYVGKTFGAFLVLESTARTTSGGGYKQYLRVRCKCGTELERPAEKVTKAANPMCVTCRRKERAALAERGTKHPLYKVWRTMLSRCYDENVKNFPRYGGRGIYVCPEWRGSVEVGELGAIDGFKQFVVDMGPRPGGATIDRKDNDGPYSRDNCQWATYTEQANNRSNNVRITVGGVTKTITQWQRALGANNLSRAAYAYGVALPQAVREALRFYPQDNWDWAKVFATVATKKPQFSRKVVDPLSDEQQEAFDEWVASLGV